jgi:hypothetical protein
MVTVIKADRGPLIHVHVIERHVHGNSIALHVWGEMKIAAKEFVYARELMLNTIQVLNLTPETGFHAPFHVQKYIYHKGEYDNLASVDIFSWDYAYEMQSGSRQLTAVSHPAALPSDGSIWLDFEALGE